MQFDANLNGVWGTVAESISNFMRERAIQAAYDLCPLMDELERRIHGLDPAFVEDYLERLRSWSKSLPHELRSATGALATSADGCRESFVGAAHVACM